MFTGIVREVGSVRSVVAAGDRRIEIWTARPPETIETGASIACNGICLTVVEAARADGRPWFAVEASAETARRTTLAGWTAGTPVNLEPAMRVGDELGGHIVSGHVDATAEIVGIEPEGDSHRVVFAAPARLGRFIAEKGSVALDGISLTVNAVEDAGDVTRFTVNIIPHTWSATSLHDKTAGDRVNLEIDLMARYVARLAEKS